MVVTIDDQDWKILKNLLDNELSRIDKLQIPEVDKEILSERYKKVLEHINDSSKTVASEWEKAKADRELRKKEEKQRNQLHIVEKPVETECIRNGKNLEVVEKQPEFNRMDAKLPKWTQEELDLIIPWQREEGRRICKAILVYHNTCDMGTSMDYIKQMRKAPQLSFSELSKKWVSLYNNLRRYIEKLVECGYLKKKIDEGGVIKFTPTELGKAVIDRLDKGGLQIEDVQIE